MKKFIRTILLAVLVLSMLCASLFGCSGVVNWQGNGITNAGEVKSVGGFIAETDNYYYFINGIGTNTDDNTMGTPVKGALYALDKSDLSKEATLVVPKLFVMSDYTAGVYIYDGYIYYGTPSTDKNSSGKVASDEMLFVRTTLDGTRTETLFSAGNAFNTSYRISQANGNVYVIYYDTTDSALKSYNVTSKTTEVIAKIDSTAKRESLGGYLLVDNDSLDKAVVIYSVTVYTEDYNAEKASMANYSRSPANYNRVYAYKAGDSLAEGSADCRGTKILDGEKAIPERFSPKAIVGGYLFCEVANDYNTSTFALSINDLAGARVNVINSTYAASTSIVKSLQEVYVYENNLIKKVSLTGNLLTEEVPLAMVSTVSSLLFVEGDYVYYVNSDSKLARIKIANVDANKDADLSEQIISGDTIATEWYAPRLVGDKIFYCDNSSMGLGYVYYVSTNIEDSKIVTEENDDETITYYLAEGEQHFVGKMTDKDLAEQVGYIIYCIDEDLDDGKIVLDTTDANGNPAMQAVLDARAAYEALTDAQRGLVDEINYTLLKRCETVTALCNKLEKLRDFDKLSDDAKDALRTDFESIKEDLEKIKNADQSEYTETRLMFMTNFNYWYQCAEEYFAE